MALSTKASEDYFKVKYPEVLLTQSYGILSEHDLLFEIINSRINKWRCFPSKEARFEIEYWRGPDPMGAANIHVDMCFMSISAKSESITYKYLDRRARNLNFCQDHKREWDRLVKDEPFLCINGETHDPPATAQDWTWEKTKTNKGCDSLFVGRCDTEFPIDAGPRMK